MQTKGRKVRRKDGYQKDGGIPKPNDGRGLECFFFFGRAIDYLASVRSNVFASKGGGGKLNKDLAQFGWYGHVLFLADGVQNIKLVEQMNLYDFLTALSYKIARNEAMNEQK